MSDQCLFCKIIKGEIPSKKIYEDNNVIGFNDLYPQAKTHLLFIHKFHTSNINEMSSDVETLGQVFKAIKTHTESSGIDKSGFRVVTNMGPDAGQTVFHTHFHVLAGEKLAHFGA
jgi:histidine triad (HIT) family protein